MNKLFRRSMIALILAALLLGGVGFFLFEYVTQANDWAIQTRNPHLYTNAVLKNLRITDRNGTLLFSSEQGDIFWHEDATVRKTVLHAIGDLQGNIGSGILYRCREELINFGHINGLYTYVSGGCTLLLNMDAQLCAAAGKALGGHKGAVGLFNYRTGEVYAMVSAPNFDPLDPPQQTQEGTYLNRFLSAVYTPGSIFKIVTLQAALESVDGLEEMTFTCKGKCEIGGEVITCSGYHGQQDIAKAFANSCNCAFGELAMKVGAEKLKETAQRAGLTAAGTVDGYTTAAGRVEATDDAPAQLAWAAIGQHLDTVNPGSFLRYVGAIANGGEAVEPQLRGSMVRGSGAVRPMPEGSRQRIMDERIAQKLTEYMKNNVTEQYGAWRFGDLTVGAKSGTAQQDNGAAHSVFTGFVADENTPIAFFVLAEHAGSGQGVALQVADSLLKQIEILQ